TADHRRGLAQEDGVGRAIGNIAQLRLTEGINHAVDRVPVVAPLGGVFQLIGVRGGAVAVPLDRGAAVGPVAERGVFHARDFHRVYPWGGDIRAAGLKGGGRARENLAPLEPDRVVAVAPPVHHGTRIRVDGGREVIIDLKGS